MSKDEAQVRASQLDDAPASPKSQGSPRKLFRSRFYGWRGSLKLFCLLAWLLGAVNLAVSIVVTVNSDTGVFTRSTTLMAGNCDHVNSTDMWIHLAMNIASTSLLACTVSAVLQEL